MATTRRTKMEDKSIISVFRHGPVADRMLPDSYYKESGRSLAAPELVVGLELEIEQFSPDYDAQVEFSYETDGSLRNSGMEAISHPTKIKFVEAMLHKFYRRHEIDEKKNYSERCSTHVHMNVQDITFSQLQSITLLYQTTERLLFDYVGNDRKNNIFCVPWYESGLSSLFISRLHKDTNLAVRGWMKYTACNLIPVSTQGTLEFRHLHGTCNVEVIMGWLNILGRLYKYGTEVPYKEVAKTILDMNTVSNYEAFLKDVFLEWSPLVMREGYRESLTAGVVDSKIMLITPPKVTKKALEKRIITDEQINEMIVNFTPTGRGTPTIDPTPANPNTWRRVWNADTLQQTTQQDPSVEIPERARQDGWTVINRDLDRRLNLPTYRVEEMHGGEALDNFQEYDSSIGAVAIDWNTGRYIPLRAEF